MLISIMSKIQISVNKIRTYLKKMEKLSNRLKPTEENNNIMATMKHNMIYIDDEINKIVDIIDCGEVDFSSSDDEDEDEEMLYRLWFYKNKRYILNMDTREVFDYYTEKSVGRCANGVLIQN